MSKSRLPRLRPPLRIALTASLLLLLFAGLGGTAFQPQTARAQDSPALTLRIYLPAIVTQPAAPLHPPAGAGWLAVVNYYRAMAHLPAATENTAWSNGDWYHSRYIVKNNVLDFTEDTNNRWYTPAGSVAAANSNLLASSGMGFTDEYAIDAWMQGPFHAVGIINSRLHEAGYGSYREADGGLQLGAGLDVLRGLRSVPATVTFPVKYPGDGMLVSATAYYGGEIPDPLQGCPGYSQPSGAPVILQMGAGNLVPHVSAHSFSVNGNPLAHCVYDETNYANPDSSLQGLGRAVLNARDAVVLIPRSPLTPGATYRVSLTVSGQYYTWSFKAVSQPANASEVWDGEMSLGFSQP